MVVLQATVDASKVRGELSALKKKEISLRWEKNITYTSHSLCINKTDSIFSTRTLSSEDDLTS